MSAPTWIAPAFAGDRAPFVHGVTLEGAPDLKSDPTSKDHAEAVTAIAAVLGLQGLGWARQVHGNAVLRIEKTGCVGEADALWCDRPGLGVIGRSADCPLVLVEGSKEDGAPIWGMAHSSWRSAAAGINLRLLGAMIVAGLDAATVRAQVGPCAGPCCYEVGEEVKRAFLAGLGPASEAWFQPRDDRFLLNLRAAVVHAFANAGIAAEAVALDDRCTICGEGFPSYRRDGDAAGRFGMCLGVV